MSENSPISRRDFLKKSGMTGGLAVAALLSACAPANPIPAQAPATTAPAAAPAPTAVPPPKAVAKIVWWTEAVPATTEEALNKLFLKAFNDSHPDTRLELVWAADLIDKIKVAVAGGGGPDIIETGGPSTNVEFYDAGYVIPLDDYAAKYHWGDIMAPWALAYGTTRGKLVSVQLTQETQMMVYNKGLLEQKGWKLPTGPDDLAELAKACLKDGIIPYATWNGWGLYISFAWNDYSSALSTYKWLTGQIPFTSDEFVGAIDYLKMMLKEGWLGDKVLDLRFGDEWPLLAEGKALMKMDGSWAFKSGADAFAKFDWDVAPLPNLRNGINHTWAIGSGESLSLASTCKAPAAGAEVLDFIYNDPKRVGQIMAAHPGEWVVPILTLKDSDIPDTLDPRMRKLILWMKTAAAEDNVGYLTWSSWPPLAVGVSTDYCDAAIRGEITTKDYCAKIQDQFAQEFKEGKVLEIPKTRGA